jgi:hypothetical protein
VEKEKVMPAEAKNQAQAMGAAFSEQTIEYSRKLWEFGFRNTSAAFDGTQRLAKTKSPQEFYEVLTNLTREHFERISEELEELNELASPTKSSNDNTGTGFWE